MRSLVLAACAAVVVAGCSPPADEAAEAPAAASAAPAAPALTDEQKAAIQASLPAPYNTADLKNGQAKFGMCKSCHTVAAGGPNLTGPNLHGTFGNPAGRHPGFKHSQALMDAKLTWDGPTLDRWVENPRAVVPGTKMSFAGLKDPKDRTDVIAYMAVEGGEAN